jgi:glycosyltransferase involved in cell wall biosynthesis
MRPPDSKRLSATVLICTYNRAQLLRETLESLRMLESSRHWDVIVVDNNSSDGTRAVIEELAPDFSVPLLYLFEPKQGKSHALNSGLRHTRADVILFTDDDVTMTRGWLDAACAPLEDDPSLSYTGGPVRPLWGADPPAWFDQDRSELWGTLAILDYGAESFVFEARQRVPVGANMAVRRRLIEQIGGFHLELGRRGRSLLGQEQAEFFSRARAFGARGRYAPNMEVHHHVPPERLTKEYFRRWWYWKGVSRARVDAMHGETELGLNLRNVPYLAGVPRFVWGLIARSALRGVAAGLSRRKRRSMYHQMQCAYAAGYVRACWSRRAVTAAPGSSEHPHETASASR